MVIGKPGSKVVVALKGVPFGQPLGPIARADRRITRAGHVPVEGDVLRRGEALLVAMSKVRVFGPFKLNMPEQVYRFDGTLIWKRPQLPAR